MRVGTYARHIAIKFCNGSPVLGVDAEGPPAPENCGAGTSWVTPCEDEVAGVMVEVDGHACSDRIKLDPHTKNNDEYIPGARLDQE